MYRIKLIQLIKFIRAGKRYDYAMVLAKNLKQKIKKEYSFLISRKIKFEITILRKFRLKLKSPIQLEIYSFLKAKKKKYDSASKNFFLLPKIVQCAKMFFYLKKN